MLSENEFPQTNLCLQQLILGMGKWSYRKGAFWERELMDLLREKGFQVMRAAGSGVAGDCPDVLALKTTKKFALECKAWKESIYIEKKKFRLLEEWEKNAGLPVFLAWKSPRKEWRFFPLSALRETKKNFVVLESDLETGISLQELV